MVISWSFLSINDAGNDLINDLISPAKTGHFINEVINGMSSINEGINDLIPLMTSLIE